MEKEDIWHNLVLGEGFLVTVVDILSHTRI